MKNLKELTDTFVLPKNQIIGIAVRKIETAPVKLKFRKRIVLKFLAIIVKR